MMYMPCICIVYTKAIRMVNRLGVMAKKDDEKVKKKDSQLILRLDKKERDRFVQLCKDLDTTAAREIRGFIRKFMKEHE